MRGSLDMPSFTAVHYNAACGDKLTIQGIICDGILEKAVFEGSGCVISQAMASLLLEKYNGSVLVHIQNLTEKEVKNLLPIPLGPVRFKCALLALEALQKGVREYAQSKQAV